MRQTLVCSLNCHYEQFKIALMRSVMTSCPVRGRITKETFQEVACGLSGVWYPKSSGLGYFRSSTTSSVCFVTRLCAPKKSEHPSLLWGIIMPNPQRSSFVYKRLRKPLVRRSSRRNQEPFSFFKFLNCFGKNFNDNNSDRTWVLVSLPRARFRRIQSVCHCY